MALITCPECRHTISDRARTCPRCGCEFEDEDEQWPDDAARRPRTWEIGLAARGALIALFVIFALGMLGILRATREKRRQAIRAPRNAGVAPVAQHAPDPVRRPMRIVDTSVPVASETVVLERPGDAGDCHVCMDLESYERLEALLRAKDDEGRLWESVGDFSAMREQGSLLIIVNGVHAELLRKGSGKYLVRILDGYYAGRTGWINAKHVKRIEAPKANPRPVIAKAPPATRAPTPVKKAPKPKTEKPQTDAEKLAQRMASELNIARNLDRSDKNEAALKAYREILSRYPGTDAAKEAARRIKTFAEAGIK